MSLIEVKITDLFFVHQRGRVNAIYQLMLNGGVCLDSFLCGFSSVHIYIDHNPI